MNYRQPDAQVIFVTNTSFFLMDQSFNCFPMLAPMFKVKRRPTIWPRLSNITRPTVTLTPRPEGHDNRALD